MAGNAHRNRARTKPCPSTCPFCKDRPKEGKARKLFRNHNGHRHNPAQNKKQKRSKR